MKTAFACTSLVAVAAFASARPEPNAFLNTTAPSLASLIKQVKSDPQVFNRYYKHFGMNQTELVSYFASLRPAKIPKSGPYIVYNIREDGMVRSRIFSLKAGSLIYVDVAGTPILKKICGNPMTPGPNKLEAVLMPTPPPIVPPAEVKGEFEEAPQPLTVEEMTPVEELEAPPFEAVPPIQPPIVPPNPPTITPPTEIMPPIGPTSPSLNLGSLLPLLGGALITTIGGGNTGGTAVPEPATLASFVLLAGAFAASRKRRRR